MPDILQALLEHKALGNTLYQQKDYDGAIKAYAVAVKILLAEFPDLEDEDQPPPSDETRKQAAIVLCNRAACHIGQKKAVRALADAQLASDFDASNWKVRPPDIPCTLDTESAPSHRRTGERDLRS